MTTLRDTWRLRASGETLLLELFPGELDAATRERSVGELRRVAAAARGNDPEAVRVLLELHARLRGMPPPVTPLHSTIEGPRVAAVAEELLTAAQGGQLVARRLERRSVFVPLEGALEPVLGPDSSASDDAPVSKSWLGITLVDQTGAPVPNRPYRVIQPDGTTVDGMLDSHGAAMLRNLDTGNCQIWCPYVEPHGPLTYTVKDGDHASGIAQAQGFDDYSVVWNDGDNAELQGQRTDPHVLVPGDQLTIPEVKEQPAANKPTGAKHPFTIDVSPLKLRFKVLDLKAKPVAGAQVTVAGTTLTTDGDGLVEADLDKAARDVAVSLPAGDVDMQPGGLNPADDGTDAGWKARLFNMGFLWDPTVDDADDEMLIALQDFQAQYSLKLSGQLDDATKAKLLDVYGC